MPAECEERLLEVALAFRVAPPEPAEAPPVEQPGVGPQRPLGKACEPPFHGLSSSLTEQRRGMAADQSHQALPVFRVAEEPGRRLDPARGLDEPRGGPADLRTPGGWVGSIGLRAQELAEQRVVFVHGFGARRPVGEVVLPVELGENLAGLRPSGERRRHRCRHPGQVGGLQEHLPCLGVGLLEDLAGEVVEENLRRRPAGPERSPALAPELLEQQDEPRAPPVG